MRRAMVMMVVAILAGSGAAGAQTAPPNAAGVSFGHAHLIVKDLEGAKKFWTAIGAKMAAPLGANEVALIPNMPVFFRQGDQKGGSVGSVVRHLGLKVPNAQEAAARWKAAGIKVEPGNRPQQIYVYTPDDVQIEVLEDAAMTVPVAGDHLHFFVPEATIPEIQAWYVKTFGAPAGKRNGTIDIATLPGDVVLSFGKTADGSKGVPTQGRSLDHIGFEVVGLEAFCKKLEAAGVKFDRPYQKSPTGLMVANITDPWGTYIELSEGIDKMR